MLVACSGGPDSVVMADVLARLAPELGLTLTVASVDHGLRPEAPAEVQQVGALARAWGLPFKAISLRVEPGPGVQARARDARYLALEAARREHGAAVIAVGHTRDDQAETVLSRLLRGSGVRGLRGVTPARTDGVVRPLIDCARADVHGYLAARQPGAAADVTTGRNALVAVADPSNHDLSFERVRLRHVTLPALRVEDADVDRHLAELADDARDLVELAERAGDELLTRALVAHGHGGERALDVAVLRDAPRAARLEAIRQLVEGGAEPPLVCRRAHRLELEQAVFGPPGAHVLVGRGVAYRRVGGLLVEEGGQPERGTTVTHAPPREHAVAGTGHEPGGLRPGPEETTKLDV